MPGLYQRSLDGHETSEPAEKDAGVIKSSNLSPLTVNPLMAVTTPTIEIQQIDSIPQMKALEKLQQDVWGWSDLDTTPLMDFIIMRELGGTLIGAFEAENLVGFAWGFVGYDEGQVVFHSHMLAVHPSYRECGLGFRLKLAQRVAALERGFEHITWTFDPLQSTNAHLNFHKLGVVANRYKANFYGEQSSSLLHRHIGTDRLWVNWFLRSKRVRDRVDSGRREDPRYSDTVHRLARSGIDGLPVSHAVDFHGGSPVLIEIPANIGSLQQQNPESAVAWRNATRAAFADAFAAGYRVVDFLRNGTSSQPGGYYVLVPRRENELD
jgi:predicted GNAT superfamily acetyltransferase